MKGNLTTKDNVFRSNKLHSLKLNATLKAKRRLTKKVTQRNYIRYFTAYNGIPKTGRHYYIPK